VFSNPKEKDIDKPKLPLVCTSKAYIPEETIARAFKK